MFAGRVDATAASLAAVLGLRGNSREVTAINDGTTNARQRHELGWAAERDVDAMCRDTWHWQSRNPRGYAG